MRLYAVRVLKDQQPVGFFWAPDALTLWWTVDSVCDPGLCECHRITTRAAITWPGKVSGRLGVPLNFDDEDTGDSSELDELREELIFDYALEDYFHSDIKEGWEKLPFADEPGGGIREMFNARKKPTRSTAANKKRHPK